MLRKILILASLSGLFAGCAPASAPAPTLLPAAYIPTLIAMTGEAAQATSQALITPTLPALPTRTPLPFTPLPTATFTPQPHIPLAQIQFLAPGPMSRFVSPVLLQLMIISGESDVIDISLFGEDGRLLGRIVDRVPRKLSGLYAVYKIPFEIRAAAETALLQVSTKDKEGRMRSLNTLPITLLSTGATETTPAGNIIYERAVFYTPASGDKASDGEVNIKGRFWPFNTQPVFLELILPDGKSFSRVLDINNLDPQEFSTTIPYKVSELTLARLTVRQMDPLLNAPIYVYTQDIWLNP